MRSEERLKANKDSACDATSYQDFLNSREWKTQRARILRRDAHTCQICGRNDGIMQAHHIVYERPIDETRDRCLITLCNECHKRVHKVQALMNTFADKDLHDLKMTWGKRMGQIINDVFTEGVNGKKKTKAIRIIRDTFYEQRNLHWRIMPDFTTLQKEVNIKKKTTSHERHHY